MKAKLNVFTAPAICIALASVWIGGFSVFSADQAAGPTPLERALQHWTQGQKDSAITEFLQIDWRKNPGFSANSPLSTPEKDLQSMSAPARETLMNKVMASLKELKQLAAAVKERGVSSGKPEVAKQCREKLDQCGTALNKPESLKILQLTAQAIRKMAAGI